MSDLDNSAVPRSLTSRFLLALYAAVLFVSFIVLGTWQIKRLYWKQNLIERVEQRVHAPAAAVPDPAHWNKVSAESHEYRHVRVSGVFLDKLSTQVQASTIYGRGFWVMTPLRLADGSSIFVNRGFIAYGAHACASSVGRNEITGLLRISEPGGAFLRSNNPAQQQWYSRDIAALAASKQLSRVAPFFIDAAADNRRETNTASCQDPIAGLTVIAFHNNHLVYAITWYTLALMIVVAGFMLRGIELKMQRFREQKPSPQ